MSQAALTGEQREKLARVAEWEAELGVLVAAVAVAER